MIQEHLVRTYSTYSSKPSISTDMLTTSRYFLSTHYSRGSKQKNVHILKKA